MVRFGRAGTGHIVQNYITPMLLGMVEHALQVVFGEIVRFMRGEKERLLGIRKVVVGGPAEILMPSTGFRVVHDG